MAEAKTKSIPPRSAVKQEDTWDLTPLYRSDTAWERAFKKLERMTADFATFRGRLHRSAKAIRACFDFQTEFEKLAERIGSYAFLKSAEDVANNTYQAMVARYIHVATVANEAASFIAPEIQAIPVDRMRRFQKSKELEPYRFQLKKLLRYRPHILSHAEERLLALQGEVAGTAGRIFGQLNDADLKFGFITDEKGVKVELTQSSFRTLLESPRRAVRKRAYEQFYQEYEDHANTLAASLSASVLQDVYHARVRKFSSCLNEALFADNVPSSVYDSLIQAVHDNLPTVYRYLELRRKALRVKNLHVYDNYVPIVKSNAWKQTYDEAVGMVVDALAPLGAAYCGPLEKGLRSRRWVDRYENRGKRSGAFSAGGYTGPPYILMNYQEDLLDSVFTLAHEAGHSMHTYFSARTQPFQDYDYTIFVAEVASTFNEQLLSAHLLAQANDKKTRAYLINREIDEIRGTLVRQTMFAEFEKTIHAIAEVGEPLTLERLRNEYRALLELYFGPDFVLDESLSLESLRIPHFYSAFYVYKYATGIAAAITLARRVAGGGSKERERYLNFLRAGGSKFPLDLLRGAGVDLTSPAPVATAMERFNALVAELEELV
ncbi:MAG: oligoendopeptidase F [Candidatus Hydrogenedentales bacterium]|jgi:oligoendopeptidase F